MGNRWGDSGNSVRLYFGGSKITLDGDCSHEIKRRLLLRRKIMTNLDSILKSRNITLPAKVHLVKAMVFPVVMYGCESWTVKKAECQKIDAFELWCWRRLLRVPWTARRSNQSILKEISPGCSLEGLMLKLKLKYLGHLMWRVDSLEKTLMLGGIGGRRRRRQEDEKAGWHHQRDGHEFEQTLGVCDGQGGLACCSPWGRKESDTTERLNWTELNWTLSNGLAWWLRGKDSTCQCKGCVSNPQVRKVCWRRKWQPQHCSILAWEVPWTEEAGRPDTMGLQKSQTPLSN